MFLTFSGLINVSPMLAFRLCRSITCPLPFCSIMKDKMNNWPEHLVQPNMNILTPFIWDWELKTSSSNCYVILLNRQRFAHLVCRLNFLLSSRIRGMPHFCVPLLSARKEPCVSYGIYISWQWGEMSFCFFCHFCKKNNDWNPVGTVMSMEADDISRGWFSKLNIPYLCPMVPIASL